MNKEDIKIIKNDIKNGQIKCSNCGASNVYYDDEKQKIICNYCSCEFDKTTITGKKSSFNLEGEIRGLATKDIDSNASSLITLRCDGCGAEITINTDNSLKTKCHWCGSDLSINQQIGNGMIPDEILPFKLTREEAFDKILNYTEEKLKFATKNFKKGLTIENVRGVFFPYLIFDGKAHGHFKGFGEHRTKTYHDDDDDTYYDADVYQVEREFDLAVEDLTIESNSERLNKFNTKQKNNVINAIMPFDTENCIQFQASYMKDYNSEKRDIDISEIDKIVKEQVKDIARRSLLDSLSFYDRGVRWEYEGMKYIGKQWLSAYLPVWLYSCYDKKGVLHYVAVNGRTGETVGSIPFNRSKLYWVMLIIFLVFISIGGYLSILAYMLDPSLVILVLSLCGGLGFCSSIVYFIIVEYKYSHLVWNRHYYELETSCGFKYTNKVDEKVKSLHRVSNRMIKNANSKKINGKFVSFKKNTM